MSVDVINLANGFLANASLDVYLPVLSGPDLDLAYCLMLFPGSVRSACRDMHKEASGTISLGGEINGITVHTEVCECTCHAVLKPILIFLRSSTSAEKVTLPPFAKSTPTGIIFLTAPLSGNAWREKFTPLLSTR